MNPKSVTMTQLRRHLHRTVHDLQDNTPLTVIHRGRPVAVMVSVAVYEQIQGVEPSSTWPDGYFEQTYGALADDPLTRPEQGAYEDRAPLRS